MNAPTADDPSEKCRRCHGRICCSYVTQAIDAPRSKRDFEFLLWQLSHAGVQAYQDDDGWFLLFETRCRHLDGDGRCAIYSRRPWICRDYDHHHCEFDEPSQRHFKRYFPDDASLLDYCRRRFRRWGREPG